MNTDIVQHIVVPVPDKPLKECLLIVAGAAAAVDEGVRECRRRRDGCRGRGRWDRGRCGGWNVGSDLYELASGSSYQRAVDPRILTVKNDLPPAASWVFA